VRRDRCGRPLRRTNPDQTELTRGAALKRHHQEVLALSSRCLFNGADRRRIAAGGMESRAIPCDNIAKDRGISSRGLGRVAEKLGTAIGALPGGAFASAIEAADGDTAAIQSIFQFRNEDGHTAQQKCDFGGSAPRAVRRFLVSSNFHRRIDVDVICFLG